MNKKNKKYVKFIMITIFAGICFSLYYICIYSKLMKLAEQTAFDKVCAASYTVENNFEEKINKVKTIAEINLKNKNSEIDYNKIIETAKNTLPECRSFILNPDGTYFLENGDISNISEYAYFKEALKGKTAIGGSFDETNKKRCLAAAAPIKDSEGKVWKVLIVFYNTDTLTNVLDAVDFDKEAVSCIITKDNEVLAGNTNFNKSAENSKDTGIEDSADSFEDVIKSQMLRIKGNSFEILYNKKETALFSAEFKSGGCTLVYAVPKDILYSEIYDLNIFIIAAMFIIILAVSAAAIYSSKLTVYLKNEKKKNDFIIKSSNIIIFKTNRSGGIVDCNKNFIKIAGLKESELKKGSIYNIIPEMYYTVFNVYYERIINSEESVPPLDMPIVGKDGKWTYMLWNAGEYNKKSDCIEFVGTDISTLKEYEKKMQRIAYFDRLTGLNNLIYLEEYFNSITSVNTTKTKIAFICLDIDNFRYINDMFGYNTGDKFIIDLSDRILSVKNIKAKLCKRGGDEFVIIYEYIENDAELKRYINDIFNAMKSEYYINNAKLNVSVSMGVSIYPDDGETYEELFKCADIAMQNAKEEFKGNVKFFDNSMKNDIYEIISIENDLKSAVENNEFVLYYQPQYNIKSGKLYGFEALIRWISPKKGFVRPDKFIPQAEKNQMIIPIGKFAFRTTCDFINELIGKGFPNLCISVNISVVQMMCDDFVDFVLDTLNEKNIDPKNIKLEITESVLIKSIDDIVKKITILNSRGIKFSLDDFGTGYSSLNYLKQIPLDVLKIDKSFTDTILEKEENEGILSIILSLAKCCNLSTVAEGIEEKEQLSWLYSKNCDIAQGFYMGKPMPKDKAFEIIEKNMYEFVEQVY